MFDVVLWCRPDRDHGPFRSEIESGLASLIQLKTLKARAKQADWRVLVESLDDDDDKGK